VGRRQATASGTHVDPRVVDVRRQDALNLRLTYGTLRVREVRKLHDRWLRPVVWSAALLFCLLVWAGVYVGAGAPLPW
jgi:hypothetical protein